MHALLTFLLILCLILPLIGFAKNKAGKEGEGDDPPGTPPKPKKNGEEEDDDSPFSGGFNKPHLPFKVVGELSAAAQAYGGGARGWESVAYALANDNHKLRQQRREIAEAPEGAMIITDQAEKDALSALKSTYGSYAKAADRAKQADAFEAEKKQGEKVEAVKAAAKAAGLKNPDAFVKLPGVLDHEYDVQTMKQGDGKPDLVKVSVKLKKGTETETKDFSEWLNAEHAWALPALNAPPADPQQQPNGAPQQQPADQPGVPGMPQALPGGGFQFPAMPAAQHGSLPVQPQEGGTRPAFMEQVLAPYDAWGDQGKPKQEQK